MNDERLKPILERIPAGWGRYVDVGPGWYPIVLELDRKLAALYPDYAVHQVKEKFGGLRYYCSVDGEADADELIANAEELAARTCEACGAPGELYERRGWLSTHCAACRPADYAW